MQDHSDRDQAETRIRYINPEVPRDETVSTFLGEYTGLLTLGETPGGSKEDYKKRRARVVETHEMTVRDARGHQNVELDSWDFELNGFTVARAPAPVADFRDRNLLVGEYVPRVLDLVKETIGASRAFLIGQQIRTEATARGTSQSSYARFAHSDYGPEFEPQLRRVLAGHYGIPEAEARSCGLCCAGFWAPIERPAYQDPLCLLDSSSVDLEKESVRYIYTGLSTGSLNRNRPIEERIPTPGGDAPALAPTHWPAHQWLFVSDMRPEETLIFKQYDFRADVTSRVCFHNSFRDRFHKDWQDCPGRRSVEVRVLLTF